MNGHHWSGYNWMNNLYDIFTDDKPYPYSNIQLGHYNKEVFIPVVEWRNSQIDILLN